MAHLGAAPDRSASPRSRRGGERQIRCTDPDVGVATAMIGLVFMPDAMFEPTGFGQLAPEALTDARATYGGFQIAIGAFLVWTGTAVERHRSGLVLLSILLPAIAASRAFGLVVDDEPTAMMVGVLVLEVIMSAVSLGLLRRHASLERA